MFQQDRARDYAVAAAARRAQRRGAARGGLQQPRDRCDAEVRRDQSGVVVRSDQNRFDIAGATSRHGGAAVSCIRAREIFADGSLHGINADIDQLEVAGEEGQGTPITWLWTSMSDR